MSGVAQVQYRIAADGPMIHIHLECAKCDELLWCFELEEPTGDEEKADRDAAALAAIPIDAKHLTLAHLYADEWRTAMQDLGVHDYQKHEIPRIAALN